MMCRLLSVLLLQCLAAHTWALRVANPVRTNPAVEEKAGSGLPGTKVRSVTRHLKEQRCARRINSSSVV